MMSRFLTALAIVLSLGFTCDPHDTPTSAEYPPGLVYSLKRLWQGGAADDPYGGSAPFAAVLLQGIDTGAPSGSHFSWYMVSTDEFVYDYRKLPPGLVFGLKHSRDPGTLGVKVRGVDPADPDDTPPAGLRRMHGGDLGLPAGSGYYWFESTGEDFAGWSDETDRHLALDALPRRFVVGLMHSVNTPGYSTTWPVWVSSISAFETHTFRAAYQPWFDPRTVWPPFDLVRQEGGDYGASSGEGYFWYVYKSGPAPAGMPTCKDGRKPGDDCDDQNWMTDPDKVVMSGDDCACMGQMRSNIVLSESMGTGTGCIVFSTNLRRCDVAGIQNLSGFSIRIVLCGDSTEQGDNTCCNNKPSLIASRANGQTLSSTEYFKCNIGQEPVSIAVCPVQPGATVMLRVFTKDCEL